MEKSIQITGEIGEIVPFTEGQCSYCKETNIDLRRGTFLCGWDGTREKAGQIRTIRICEKFKKEENTRKKSCDCPMDQFMNYGCKCGGE